MKKFFKNTLIAISIICLFLNIINLIAQIIQHYYIATPYLIEIAEQVKLEGISSEDAYKLLASFYSVGFGNKIEIQIGILGMSLLFGIAIGLLYTFEENSKFKIVLYYFLGLSLVALVPTLINLLYYLSFNIFEFFEEFIYNLEITWKWYTVAFIILYALKIFITNEKTKQLNKILENKNKSN